jgi:hypothetical protein
MAIPSVEVENNGYYEPSPDVIEKAYVKNRAELAQRAAN